jgi:hypothetical protein
MACGFPAFANGRDIREAHPAPTPGAVEKTATDHWLTGESSFLLFFPEAIPAVAVLVYSPFWFVSLLSETRFLAAGALFAGVCSACAVAYFARSKRSKGFVYIAMVLLIFVAGAVNIISSNPKLEKQSNSSLNPDLPLASRLA